MVSARYFTLLSLLHAAHSGEVCTADCEEAPKPTGSEYTGLIQSRNRRAMSKLGYPKTAWGAGLPKAAGMLEAAKKLLRNGETQEVTLFIEATFLSIEAEVEPAIAKGHADDKKLLENYWDHFLRTEELLESKLLEVKGLAEAETAASQTHAYCRMQQYEQCEERQACERELNTRWDNVTSWEDSLDVTTNEIQESYCVSEDDGTSDAFREWSVERFTTYTSKKHWVDFATNLYNEWVPICEANRTAESIKRAECELDQTSLEDTSCEHLAKVVGVQELVRSEWDIAEENYKNATVQVQALEEVRKKELQTLAEVKCILESMKNKVAAGKPCDETSDPEGTSSALSSCHSVVADTSSVEMIYNATPPLPELPGIPVHPGTAEFSLREYARWAEVECVTIDDSRQCSSEVVVEAEEFVMTTTTTTATLPLTNCPAPNRTFSICSAWGEPHFSHVFFKKSYDEHVHAESTYTSLKSFMKVGPYELARSNDGSFVAQAFFCWGGFGTSSTCGLALKIGKDTVTFVRGAKTGPPVVAESGTQMFDFIGSDGSTAKDSVDIRVNGQLVDWDELGEGTNGGGATDPNMNDVNGGSWAPKGQGGGKLFENNVWMQQLDVPDVEQHWMMSPVCLGDAERSFTFSFGVPWVRRYYEPFFALYLPDDLIAEEGICGREELDEDSIHKPVSWEDSLFSVEETHQLCQVCGMAKTKYDPVLGRSVTKEQFIAERGDWWYYERMRDNYWDSLEEDVGCVPPEHDEAEDLTLEERCEQWQVGGYATAQSACAKFDNDEAGEGWYEACIIEYCASGGDAESAVELTDEMHQDLANEAAQVAAEAA